MEEFKINCTVVREVSDRIYGFKKDISRNRDDVSRIRRNLRNKIAQSEAISARLKTIEDTLFDLGNHADYMGLGLRMTEYYYQRAEDRIVGNSNLWKELLDLFEVGTKDSNPFSGLGILASMAAETVEDKIPGLEMDFMKGSRGDRSGEGSVFHVGYGGLNADVLTGEYKWDADAQADEENLGAHVSGSVEGSLGKVTYEDDSALDGLLKNEAELGIVTGAVSGRAGAQLFRDGKLDPGIYASAEAKGSVASGSLKSTFGADNLNTFGELSGEVLGAEAYAKAGAGFLGTDTDGHDVYGVEAQAGAEAYLAEGTVSSGINILGVEIEVGLTGKLGGAGGEVGMSATNHGIDLSGGLGLGAGLGLDLSIDWSNIGWPSWPW